MDFTKECFVNITYGPNCGQQLYSHISETTGDSVSTPELPLIEDISEYCFIVTARSNNVTVSVEGTLNLIEVVNVIGKKNYGFHEKNYHLVCTIFDNIGIATSAVVVPLVAIFGGAMIIILLLLYQFKRSLIIIRFSNPDKTGSLAQMLKVFKVIKFYKHQYKN